MVDISPESNIFGIFRNLNYTPWGALAEFVDNGIAAWENWDVEATGSEREPKVKVAIEIDTSGREPQIEIRDNATGIALRDFDRAFKVAAIPPKRTGLNEFGMGMKTAGFWFSNNWTVHTSFCGEPKARTMRFNLDEILSQKLREVHPGESPSTAGSHFTTVRLADLNQVPTGRTVGKIKLHLTDIYREFLRDGVLELEYNGELLTYDEPKVLISPSSDGPDAEPIEWKKTFEFDLLSGRSVRGWAALRETASTAYAGFALFRRRRIIRGSADETYRPAAIFGASNSYRWQRLFGEIHFDDSMGVTQDKSGFNWQEGEEDDFIEKLRQALTSPGLNLLQQAERYRVRGARPNPETLTEALEAVKETFERVLPQSIQEIQPQEADVQASIPEFITTTPQQRREAKTVELDVDTDDDGLWKVRIRGVSDESLSDFFRVGATEPRTGLGAVEHTFLEVQVNLAHPFAVRYLGPNLENSELLFAFTASLAVALALGRSVGAKSQYIVEYINAILRFGKGIR